MIRFVIFLVLVSTSSTSKVLELSDKFLDVYKEGQWFIKLYAPWCGHCKNLEPVWEEVHRHFQNSPITVAAIDCARYTSVAHHFKIKGFPTIILLKNGKEFVFNGDRTKDDLVKFVQRLTGPPVQEIEKSQDFISIKNRKDASFLYVGDKQDRLWDTYDFVAHKFQEHAYFYSSTPSVAEKYVKFQNTPTLFVFREYSHHSFPEELSANEDNLNTTLYNWINSERLLTFPKITRGNIGQFYLANKYLVLAVIKEGPQVEPEILEFKNTVKTLIKNRGQPRSYNDPFQFGWTSSPELVNNIALMTVPIPSIMVINTTSSQYHIPKSDEKLTLSMLESFLEDVLLGKIPSYGGNSAGVRLYRIWYELRGSIISMWKSNPILTSILFGLPSMFMLLICKTGICWPPPDDAEEGIEEAFEETENHEKKD